MLSVSMLRSTPLQTLYQHGSCPEQQRFSFAMQQHDIRSNRGLKCMATSPSSSGRAMAGSAATLAQASREPHHPQLDTTLQMSIGDLQTLAEAALYTRGYSAAEAHIISDVRSVTGLCCTSSSQAPRVPPRPSYVTPFSGGHAQIQQFVR